MKSVLEALSDPWAQFSAIIDGGGVVAEASASGGVAAVAALCKLLFLSLRSLPFV
jgi:hypothetical protein